MICVDRRLRERIQLAALCGGGVRVRDEPRGATMKTLV